MNLAKEVMNGNVITVFPDTSVEEAMEILLTRRISGLPVVNRNGALCGIITEFQMLELLFMPELRKLSVSELMTTDVLTVDAESRIEEVADKLLIYRIRRMPVVSQGKLVGVISRRDVLRFMKEQDIGCEGYRGVAVNTLFTEIYSEQ